LEVQTIATGRVVRVTHDRTAERDETTIGDGDQTMASERQPFIPEEHAVGLQRHLTRHGEMSLAINPT
jgi:hypothetical protein